MGPRIALFACVIASFLLHDFVAGHGFLDFPKARNLLSGIDTPHGLNAGGPWVVNGNGRLKWPQRMAGQCGDPFQSDRRHEKLGRATAAFVEGQTVSFKVKITAYHKGRFEFRICKTKDGKLSEACFERNALRQAGVRGAQKAGDRFFYLGNRDDYVGETFFTAQYALPKGLTCDGRAEKCVLQWRYTTGNSCTPPGTPRTYADQDLDICGREAWLWPEEFTNCADITIAKKKPAGRRLQSFA